MTLKFYYAPLSCALATHIVLEHVGAETPLGVRDLDTELLQRLLRCTRRGDQPQQRNPK